MYAKSCWTHSCAWCSTEGSIFVLSCLSCLGCLSLFSSDSSGVGRCSCRMCVCPLGCSAAIRMTKRVYVWSRVGKPGSRLNICLSDSSHSSSGCVLNSSIDCLHRRRSSGTGADKVGLPWTRCGRFVLCRVESRSTSTHTMALFSSFLIHSTKRPYVEAQVNTVGLAPMLYWRSARTSRSFRGLHPMSELDLVTWGSGTKSGGKKKLGASVLLKPHEKAVYGGIRVEY